MKKIKVFINGLGRIGRVFIRQNFNNPDIDIVGLNDPNISSKNLEYLLSLILHMGEYRVSLNIFRITK